MELAKIEVSRAEVRQICCGTLTSGMVGAEVIFTFDASWDGLKRIATFKSGDVAKDVLLTDDRAKIPPEVLQKPSLWLEVGIYGTTADGTLVIPTIWATMAGVNLGAKPSGNTSSEPAPEIWAQILGLLGDLKALDTVAKDSLVSAINEALCKGADPEQIRAMVEQCLDESGSGGYYTPTVTQPDATTMEVSYTPSQEGMPEVPSQKVTLPCANILVSPDGTKWTLSIDNNGTVSAVKVSDDGTGGEVVPDPDIPEEVTYSMGEPSDFDYNTVGTGIYLKEYIGEKANLEIPATMELDGTTYSVFLWNLRFSHSTAIERIKIDNGVASYGDTPIVIAIFKAAYGDTEDASPVKLKSIEGMENLASATVYPSFKDCVALERIPLFPEGATATRHFPFWNCDSLTDISYLVIPAGITSISGWFSNCDNLEVGCTIPTHVENANQAFYGCPNLKRFRVESLTATIDDITTGVQTECEMECYSNSQAFQTMKANAPLQAFGTDIGNYLGVKAIDNDILSVSCFGDSLTHGQNVAPNYPTVLDGLLPEKSIVYDYGYGGSSMEGIRDRMERHRQRLVNDVVVIWAGTNGSAATESIETRLACTDEMISLLQTDKYIIMTPVYLAYSADIDTAYAEKYGSHYFSLRDWFDNNGHDISQYVWDGTHFNADGHNLIGQAVYEKMVELGYVNE